MFRDFPAQIRDPCLGTLGQNSHPLEPLIPVYYNVSTPPPGFYHRTNMYFLSFVDVLHSWKWFIMNIIIYIINSFIIQNLASTCCGHLEICLIIQGYRKLGITSGLWLDPLKQSKNIIKHWFGSVTWTGGSNYEIEKKNNKFTITCFNRLYGNADATLISYWH